jgi:tetratricopeptide (TPR) repeat protein
MTPDKNCHCRPSRSIPWTTSLALGFLILGSIYANVSAPESGAKTKSDNSQSSPDTSHDGHSEASSRQEHEERHRQHHGRHHFGGGRHHEVHDELFMRAREYRFSGYPDKALTLLNKEAEKYKRNAQFYVERANCCINLNKPKQAIADCTEAIRIDPNLADAYTSRAYCLSMNDKLEEAVEDYNKVLKLDDEDAMAYHNRGLAFRKLGKLKEAAADMKKYKDLTANRENRKRDMNLLGDTARMEKAGDSKKAIEFLEAQCNAQPSVLMLKRLADLYDKNNQTEKAFAAAAKAISVARGNSGHNKTGELKIAYTGSADLFLKHKKYTEAAQDFTALIDLNEPDSKESAKRESARNFRGYALGARADCYHRLHLTDKALADLAQALQIAPTAASLLSLHAEIMDEQGKYKEALEDLNKALTAADRNAYRLQRAKILTRQKEYEAALKDFSFIIDSDRGFVKEALIGRAAVYNAQNRSKEAGADQARANKLD